MIPLCRMPFGARRSSLAVRTSVATGKREMFRFFKPHGHPALSLKPGTDTPVPVIVTLAIEAALFALLWLTWRRIRGDSGRASVGYRAPERTFHLAAMPSLRLAKGVVHADLQPTGMIYSSGNRITVIPRARLYELLG